MNAGAMGGAIFDLVKSIRYMEFSGQIQERSITEIEIKYRSCPMLKNKIALGAVLHGSPGPRETIEQRMNEVSRKRWQSQPAAPRL